jgi:hypothetical protein
LRGPRGSDTLAWVLQRGIGKSTDSSIPRKKLEESSCPYFTFCIYFEHFTLCICLVSICNNDLGLLSSRSIYLLLVVWVKLGSCLGFNFCWDFRKAQFNPPLLGIVILSHRKVIWAEKDIWPRLDSFFSIFLFSHFSFIPILFTKFQIHSKPKFQIKFK